MFNLQPGIGLGFTGSKEIAFGLGSIGVVAPLEVVERRPRRGWFAEERLTWQAAQEDEELIEILQIIVQSGVLN